MLPPAKPRIFRWHIPLERSLIPGERCSRLGIDPEDRVVLVVARMDPMKGQDRAVKALKPLLRKIPRARLVLAGDGSFSSSRGGIGLGKGERWAAYLSQLSRELGLGDRVIMTGYVGQEDLEALYSRADVVLLPSIVEGFGLVVVEAWLYGKPVVVSRRAGVADLVVDVENGLLADPDDVEGIEGISEALSKILGDSELAERLGRSGRASAELCTLERGLKAELAMIEEILGGGVPDPLAQISEILGPILPALAQAGRAAAILVATWLASKIVSAALSRILARLPPLVVVHSRRAASLVVWLVGVLVLVENLGLRAEILAVIAAVGGVGAVFAFRNVITNMADKYFSDVYVPFRVGDRVSVAGHSGVVVEINPVATILIADDGRLVSIPNSFFLTNIVINESKEAWSEIAVPVMVEKGLDVAEVEAEILKRISKLRPMLDERIPPTLVTKRIEKGQAELLLVARIKRPEDKEAVSSEINRRILEAIESVRRRRRRQA